MGNCLVTKLKSEVTMENPVYLGQIRIHFKAVESPDYTKRRLSLSATKNTKMTVAGGTFVNSSGVGSDTEATIHSTQEWFYVSNNDCVVTITDKYHLNALRIYDDGELINDKELSYVNNDGTELFEMQIRSMDKTIDLSHLKDSGIVSLLNKMNAVGDISNITFGNLNVVDNSEVYGTPYFSAYTTQIRVRGSKVNINVDNINTTSLTYMDLHNVRGSVSGNIASLGSIADANVDTIDIYNSAVSGTIESFVEAYWPKKSSRTQPGTFFTLLVGKSPVTINGATPGYDYKITITSSTLEVRDYSSNTLYGSYNGSTWTYPS